MNNLTSMYLNDGLFANVCQDFARRHIRPLKDGAVKDHDWLMADSREDVSEDELDAAYEELSSVEGELAELQAAYDELTRIAAELCRACGFSMVDASGEVIG